METADKPTYVSMYMGVVLNTSFTYKIKTRKDPSKSRRQKQYIEETGKYEMESGSMHAKNNCASTVFLRGRVHLPYVL